MRTTRAPWFFLLTVLLSAVPAWAATPLLLYGPGEADPATEQRALASFNLLAADPAGAPSVRHVGTVVVGRQTIEVIGGEVRACPGSPVTVETFSGDLAEAMEHVLYQRLEQAGQTLERLDALLPCLNGVLPRGELARISYLEGVAQAYAGQEEAAQESFRRALVVSPELDWDEGFPPLYRPLFDQAIQDALRSASAPLIVEPQVGQTASLWVDGVEFTTGGMAITLAEGRHLLQWQLAAGGFSTRVTGVRAGETVTVLSRDDVVAAMLGGAGSDVARQAAAEALGELAATADVERVYVAELAGVDLLHVFTPATGTWQMADQGLVTRRLQQRRRGNAGLVCLVAGGTVTAAGMLVWGLGYAKGRELYDEAPNISNNDMYDQNVEDYHRFRTQANVGLFAAGVGVVGVGVGIPLLVSSRDRGTAGVVALQPVPGGAMVAGRW